MDASPNPRTPSTARRKVPNANANSTPDTPRAALATDSFQRATDCLRKLRDDIAIFRDPLVRNHLEALPHQPITPVSSARAATSATSPDAASAAAVRAALAHGGEAGTDMPMSREAAAKLHAMVISLHTRLSQADDAVRVLRDADLTSRKRAAHAEGKLAEVVAQHDAAHRVHTSSVDEAADRIRALETEKARTRAIAAADFARLSARVRELTQQAEAQTAARVAADARGDAAVAKAEDMQAELERGRPADDVQIRALKVERDEARAAEAALSSEVEILRRVRDEALREGEEDAADGSKRNADASLAERLQHEVVKLKTELQWRSSKSARSDDELRKVEEEVMRLRGAVRMAEGKVGEMGRLRERLVQLEAKGRERAAGLEQFEALKSEKDEMRNLICGLVPSGHVADGVQVLRSLANGEREALRMLKVTMAGNSGADGDAMDVEESKDGVQVVQKRCYELERELEIARGEMIGMVAGKERGERGRQLLLQDVDRLKGIIAALSSESKDGARGSKGPEEDGKLQMAILESQSLVETYRNTVQELEGGIVERDRQIQQLRDGTSVKKETEVSSVQRMDTADGVDVEVNVNASRKRVAELEAEVERLKASQGLGKKETVLEGKSDFDVKEMKVMHLVENPLKAAMQRWEAGEEDRRKGRKRVREMSGGGLEEMATKEEVENMRREIVEVRQEYEQLKRRAVLGDRTQQVALKRIEEVRSAVYNLFGWSMKVTGTMYRLASIYAESPEEVLHFCVNEEGTMSLVDSEYAQALHAELEQYVEKMNSFPALLAHVTMVNFDKTTAFIG